MSLPSRFLTSGVIMNDVVVNTATTTNSEILDISHAKHIGLDVFINNTGMDGNIEVEVCNDLTVTTPNWVPIELSTGSTKVAIVNATNINDFYDLTDVAAKYMQVSIVSDDAGAGTVRIVAHTKKV